MIMTALVYTYTLGQCRYNVKLLSRTVGILSNRLVRICWSVSSMAQIFHNYKITLLISKVQQSHTREVDRWAIHLGQLP